MSRTHRSIFPCTVGSGIGHGVGDIVVVEYVADVAIQTGAYTGNLEAVGSEKVELLSPRNRQGSPTLTVPLLSVEPESEKSEYVRASATQSAPMREPLKGEETYRYRTLCLGRVGNLHTLLVDSSFGLSGIFNRFCRIV